MYIKNQRTLFRLSILFITAIFLTGCIIQLGSPNPVVGMLEIKPNEVNLDFGGNQGFTVTTYDCFGNKMDVADELDLPSWNIFLDSDEEDEEMVLGYFNLTEGYEVIFTAKEKSAEDPEYLEGTIVVTLENEIGKTITGTADVTIGTKPEKSDDQVD